MAKDNKVRMPSSMAGITQYFDHDEAKIHLSPQHVVVLIVLSAILVLGLHVFAPVA